MGKYTPLCQSEFKMKLIKDLGFRHMSEMAKRKNRRAIFECSNCRTHFESNPFVVRLRGQKYCASCAMTIALTKKLDEGRVRGKILKDLGIENQRRYVIAECTECRTPFKVRFDGLVASNSGKCRPCSHIRGSTTHKGTRTRLYSIYQNMKSRCLKKYATGFENYGGRGIKVCDEWKDSFVAFREWAMASGYEEHLTIDRRDNDGNYEPDNCRWATLFVQAVNKRKRSNLTGYTGISIDKRDGIYCARISVQGKTISLGRFNTAKDGAIARDRYINKHNLAHPKSFT